MLNNVPVFVFDGKKIKKKEFLFHQIAGTYRQDLYFVVPWVFPYPAVDPL